MILFNTLLVYKSFSNDYIPQKQKHVDDDLDGSVSCRAHTNLWELPQQGWTEKLHFLLELQMVNSLKTC